MSRRDDGGAEAVLAGIAAAADLLARARRELASGGAPAIDRLFALAETLERGPGAMPMDNDCRPALLALLDDAARLAGELEVEMQDLARRLRADGARRRARLAYRRPPDETA